MGGLVPQPFSSGRQTVRGLFGTDGIRGTTDYTSRGETPLRLTPEFVLRIGQAVGQLVQSQLAGGNETNCVVLGRDPRISGMMLESAITAGLLAQGVDVVQVGVVVPTPAVAFLARRLGARLGIVISASHNQVGDNGIKFFGPGGYKLDDELEELIQSMVLDSDLTFVPFNTSKLGRLRPSEHIEQMYVDYLVQSWQGEEDMSRLFILLECANGATSYVAPEVFRRLGAKVEVVNGAPDGFNINESYEYVNPVRFGELVTQAEADFGVAFDGDGDRVILVDEQGGIVDGDTIMAILARNMLARDRLPGEVVVTTNMSNYGLHDSLCEIGVKVAETQVGDRFVLRQMLANGCTLGGERSGHILILDEEQTTGDGIYTALAVATAMIDQDGSRLSELASVMSRYPQFIESAAVPPEKPPLEENDKVQTIIEQLRAQLGAQVDVNLRYSGTEDKLRLSVRGRRGDDSSLMIKEARGALQRIAQIISA
jgi:phosphoglucosamine mutase